MSTDDLQIAAAWFDTAEPKGPAYGDPETTGWCNFSSIFEWRREGSKDGCCFILARFKPEANGRQVRRLGRNVLARTGVALDVETNKLTGEIPPPIEEAVERVKTLGLTSIVYTSHNHRPENSRYRIVFPLSEEVPPELPAPEIMAERLGLLSVLDTSKLNPASPFFLPSCPYEALELHQTVVISGAPVMAEWMVEHAGALLAARQAEADRIAAEAQVEAAARREAKIAAGFDPDDSLIQKICSRFDLDGVLRAHGYDKSGTRYRHPNSESGSFGADIKILGGVERVYSHNGGDPLHHNNLPTWCTVRAIDVFDAVVILDFAGDRDRALRELAERFNLTKASEKKAIAALLHRMIRWRATQAEIETAALNEGKRFGLSRDDVIRIAIHVVSRREAA
jgi:hypothetical protein